MICEKEKCQWKRGGVCSRPMCREAVDNSMKGFPFPLPKSPCKSCETPEKCNGAACKNFNKWFRLCWANLRKVYGYDE